MATPELKKCPFCKEAALFWNSYSNLYECLNLKCKRKITADELSRKEKELTERESAYGAAQTHAHRHDKKSFRHKTREQHFGRRYLSGQVLLLLLLTLMAIGIMAYTYYHIKELARPVVIGIMVSAAIVALWDATKANRLSKYVARRLECGTIVTSFLLVALIGCSAAAYTNVSPLYEAKNAVVAWVHKVGTSSATGTKPFSLTSETIPTPNPTRIQSGSNPPTPATPTINRHTGTYKNYYLGLVDTPGGTLSGDGCYDDSGDFIVLINNSDAVNPTYSQLVNFLQQDKTDQFPYRNTATIVGLYYGTAESHIDLVRIQNIIDGKEQPNPPQVCADFAERLHNDAEIVGIRCAYVSVDFSGYSSGHALDAFQTTDRGLVYVDDTNSPGPTRCVKTVNVQVGQEYIPQSLFPESGWNSTWDSMGTVTNTLVTWDGTWNS